MSKIVKIIKKIAYINRYFEHTYKFIYDYNFKFVVNNLKP